MFVAHTHATVPPAAKPALVSAEKLFGFVPDALARMAESAILVEAFHHANAQFEKTSLTPLEREVVVLVIARDVGCEVCERIHLAMLARQGHADLARAVLERRALADAKLEALARYTAQILATRGAVSDAELEALVAAGYDRRAALDVVVGVGAYTMSTFANRLTRAQVDPAFG